MCCIIPNRHLLCCRPRKVMASLIDLLSCVTWTPRKWKMLQLAMQVRNLRQFLIQWKKSNRSKSKQLSLHAPSRYDSSNLLRVIVGANLWPDYIKYVSTMYKSDLHILRVKKLYANHNIICTLNASKQGHIVRFNP